MWSTAKRKCVMVWGLGGLSGRDSDNCYSILPLNCDERQRKPCHRNERESIFHNNSEQIAPQTGPPGQTEASNLHACKSKLPGVVIGGSSRGNQGQICCGRSSNRYWSRSRCGRGLLARLPLVVSVASVVVAPLNTVRAVSVALRSMANLEMLSSCRSDLFPFLGIVVVRSTVDSDFREVTIFSGTACCWSTGRTLILTNALGSTSIAGTSERCGRSNRSTSTTASSAFIGFVAKLDLFQCFRDLILHHFCEISRWESIRILGGHSTGVSSSSEGIIVSRICLTDESINGK